MIRSVAHIALAIRLIQPGIPEGDARAYATTLQAVAKRHDFDPYTAVAIGWHESRWITKSAGTDKHRCVGIFQVCVPAVYPKVCGGELYDSEACLAKRRQLVDRHHAIRVLGTHISAWRRLCRTRTGRSALFHRWLAGYQGIDAVRGTVCGQRRTRGGKWQDAPLAQMTRNVMAKRRWLIRTVARRSKSR